MGPRSSRTAWPSERRESRNSRNALPAWWPRNRAPSACRNLMPVADVNSNPVNPVINTRSFGEDPALVSSLVSAYIHGAHGSGLLTAAKHFPGHGDTATDSHL